MPQHSPVPWAFTPWTKRSAALLDGRGNVIAIVSPHSAQGRAEWDANRPLIAEAPHMAAVLRDLCEWAERTGGWEAPAWERARALLARVDGVVEPVPA